MFTLAGGKGVGFGGVGACAGFWGRILGVKIRVIRIAKAGIDRTGRVSSEVDGFKLGSLAD
jgi:hypothetical protein